MECLSLAIVIFGDGHDDYHDHDNVSDDTKNSEDSGRPNTTLRGAAAATSFFCSADVDLHTSILNRFKL